MIEVMCESDGDVLGLRATGKLSVADYRDLLAPTVGALLDRFDSLKVLFLLDAPFHGWTPSAAWANTVFDVKHRNHFGKVAVVGAPRWEQCCVNVAAALLMTGELRTYDRDRLDAAWEWVRT
jgi:SpoIIAA-like